MASRDPAVWERWLKEIELETEENQNTTEDDDSNVFDQIVEAEDDQNKTKDDDNNTIVFDQNVDVLFGENHATGMDNKIN